MSLDSQAPLSNRRVEAASEKTLKPATAVAVKNKAAVARVPVGAGKISAEVHLWLQVQCAQIVPADDPQRFDAAMRAAIEMMTEFQPKNILEAMLCAQMFAVHNLAMVALSRAFRSDESPASTIAHTNCSTKLARIYLDQLSTLQRLRGKGAQQHVTVEHVHVHDGAQAIVGTIADAPAGTREK
jgi:hypothetical protein